MQHARRILMAVLALLALAAGATVASADRGGGHGGKGDEERVFALQPDPDAGNPEGIAFDKRSRAFFVSHHGARRRHLPRHARAATRVDAVHPRRRPASRPSASRSGAASSTSRAAPTGAITVYDLATKAAGRDVRDRRRAASSTTSW